MINTIKDIDFTKIIEDEDLTTLKEQVACAGNVCELV
jgi:hypothetical protein